MARRCHRSWSVGSDVSVSSASRPSGAAPGRRVRVRRWGATAGQIASSLSLYLLWRAAISGSLDLEPKPAVGAFLLIAVSLGWLYGVRPITAGDRRHRAALRLRAVRGQGTLLAAVAPWLVLDGSASNLGLRTPPAASAAGVEVPSAPMAGWLPFLLTAIIIAPLVEEIFFRGFIQRRLERVLGPTSGLVAAATLYALVCFDPPRMPGLLVRGLVLGRAVQRTRSLAAGIALHCAANTWAVAVPGLNLGLATLLPRVEVPGHFPILTGAVSLGALLWLDRRNRSGRGWTPAPPHPIRSLPA